MNFRRGNTILFTMGVVSMVFVMLTLSSKSLMRNVSIAKIDGAKQMAINAAEAIASLKEARLVDLAATNDLSSLSRNPDTGLADDPWEGVQYFNHCLVRWRVEPVRVASDDGEKWIANPPITSTDEATMQGMSGRVQNHDIYHFRIAAQAYALENRNLLNDTTIEDLDNAYQLPWQDPSASPTICSVQSVRVIQLRLNSLFKYALFFAAEGTEGDLEIGSGSGMNITGNVHSNGAIYWAGGYQSSDYRCNGWGADIVGSSTDKVQMVGIDGVYRFRKDHLFRAYLDSGHSEYDPAKINAPEPYEVPVSSANVSSNMNDRQNASGGYPNHKLNGVSFTYTDDSRSYDNVVSKYGTYLRDGINAGATIVKTLSNIPELGGRPFEHHLLASSGSYIWTTDPLNPQDVSKWSIVPNDPPAKYYVNPSSNDFNYTDTADTDTEPVQLYAKKLYYASDPYAALSYGSNAFTGASMLGEIDCDSDGDGLLDSNPGVNVDNAWPVDAEGLRVYYQRNALGVATATINGVRYDDITDDTEEANIIRDIFDPAGIFPTTDGDGDGFYDMSATVAPGSAGFELNGPPAFDADGNSFSDNAIPGIYYQWAEQGKPDGDDPDKVGLIIRERQFQRIPTSTSEEWVDQPKRPGFGSSGGGRIVLFADGQSISGSNGWTVADAIKLTDVDTGDVYIIDDDNSLNDPAIGTWNNDPYGTGGGPSVWGSKSNNPYKPFYGNGIHRSNNGQGGFCSWDINISGTFEIEFYFSNHSSTQLDDHEHLFIGDVEFDGDTPSLDPADITNLGDAIVINQKTSNGFVQLPGGPFTIGPSSPSKDYYNYLRSQYVVQFGEHDVTDLFFDYDASVATVDTDMIAFERDILDQREAVFMQYNFYDNDTTNFSSTSWQDYRVSVLTLRMDKVLAFLKDTDLTDVDGSYSGTDKINEHFNGMIYMHRTRRSVGFDPWDHMRWHEDNYNLWHLTSGGSVNYQLPTLTQPSSIFPSGTLPPYPDRRTGDGPEYTFHSAFRLWMGSDLDYGIDYVDDQGTVSASDDYKCKKGLTVISPNLIYVWGDYNTTKYADTTSTDPYGTQKTYSIGSGGSDDTWSNDNESYKLPPAAIFADHVIMLSNNWDDDAQSAGSRQPALETSLFSSIITHNIPTHYDGNNNLHSSEGVHNLIRFNESWSSVSFHLLGSNVVMKARRYGRGPIAYKWETESKGVDVYDPPYRDFEMNTDLFTRPGQPPFTPFGVTVTRAAANLYMFDNQY